MLARRQKDIEEALSECSIKTGSQEGEMNQYPGYDGDGDDDETSMLQRRVCQAMRAWRGAMTWRRLLMVVLLLLGRGAGRELEEAVMVEGTGAGTGQLVGDSVDEVGPGAYYAPAE